MQTRHNLDTCSFLATKNPKYADWEITALFYAVLHLVDDRLEKRGVQPNHEQRRRMVQGYLHIRVPYGKLYALSIKARYCGRETVGEGGLALAVRLYRQICTALG